MNFTGWLFTDARLVKCPKCGTGEGEHCHTPKGRRTYRPHQERVASLIKVYPAALKAATHHRVEVRL